MDTLDGQRAPRVLFRLVCENGHPWIAYGPDDRTHWGPIQCVKCASPWVSAAKVAELTGQPKHLYRIRMAAPKGLPAQEQNVWADCYEHREGAVVFFTGPHTVARFRRSVGDPIEVV